MTGIDTRLAGETSTYRTFPMDAGLRDQTGVRRTRMRRDASPKLASETDRSRLKRWPAASLGRLLSSLAEREA